MPVERSLCAFSPIESPSNGLILSFDHGSISRSFSSDSTSGIHSVCESTTMSPVNQICQSSDRLSNTGFFRKEEDFSCQCDLIRPFSDSAEGVELDLKSANFSEVSVCDKRKRLSKSVSSGIGNLPQDHLLQSTKNLINLMDSKHKAFALDYIMTSFQVPHLQCLRISAHFQNEYLLKNCFDFASWLPPEVSQKIFSYLDPVSLVHASSVNKLWYQLCRNDNLFRRFCLLPEWSVSSTVARQQFKQHRHPDNDVLMWYQIFKERFQIKKNWLRGRCKVRIFTGHTAGVSCVAFDDSRIVSGSADATIRVWNIRTNASWSAQTLIGHSDTVRCLQLLSDSASFDPFSQSEYCQFSPSERDFVYKQTATCLVSGSNDRTIKVWDLSNTEHWSSITCRMTLTGHTDAVRCLQADKDKIVSGSYDSTLRLWCFKTGRHKQTFVGHEGPVLCLQYDDRKIVSGSQDKTIKIWSFNGDCVSTLTGHEASVACLRFDQRFIVSGSHDYTLKFWYLGEEIVCQRTIDWKAGEGHSRVVRCVQTDNWRLLSASDDKTIKVWNLETGERLFTFQRHSDGVTCLQFNDLMIVSGSYDMTVVLWDFSVC